MKLAFSLIYLIFGLVAIPRASTGSIIGKVIDSDTHHPLIGANVIIAGTIKYAYQYKQMPVFGIIIEF